MLKYYTLECMNWCGIGSGIALTVAVLVCRDAPGATWYVDDVPNESRLEPAEWGTASVE